MVGSFLITAERSSSVILLKGIDCLSRTKFPALFQVIFFWFSILLRICFTFLFLDFLKCFNISFFGNFSFFCTRLAEVKSSRTSLALRTSSRTHFEALGLGREASSPRRLPCLRLEDITLFWTVEISLENDRNLTENLRTPFLFSLRGA